MSRANESAHPEIETDPVCLNRDGELYGRTYSFGGMTLREHYAGLAMQGILACPGITSMPGASSLAQAAVNNADRLIEELAKEKA